MAVTRGIIHFPRTLDSSELQSLRKSEDKNVRLWSVKNESRKHEI